MKINFGGGLDDTDMSQLRTTGDAQTVAVKNKALKTLICYFHFNDTDRRWHGLELRVGFLFAGSPLISMLLLGIAFGFFMRSKNLKTVRSGFIFY